jgi:predicted fused transcriptional regulator/phosphomethylpyrimidine kinase
MVRMKDPVQERNEVLYRLSLAVTHLEASAGPLLVQDRGVSLVYAVKGARDSDGVAAVPGGIVLRDGRITAGRPCAFGADAPGARIVLTVMKFDPLIRCVATIPFSENVLAGFRAMYLECSPLDNARKAMATSTMDFGVAACCNDGVPDVVYDTGTDKNPGIMHIFGEDPVVVTNNIIICSNRI